MFPYISFHSRDSRGEKWVDGGAGALSTEGEERDELERQGERTSRESGSEGEKSGEEGENARIEGERGDRRRTAIGV